MSEEVNKAREVVSAMFSSIAPVYDLLNRSLSFGRDVKWRKKLVRGMKLPEDGTVLDLCCGTGDVAIAIVREHPHFNGVVYGVDFSAIMIDKARDKVAKLGPPYPRKIDFLMGDALDLQFADEKFDAVAVAFGIRNLADLRLGVKEIYRVLKKDGQLNILEFFGNRVSNPIVAWYVEHVIPLVGNTVSRSRAYSYFVRSSKEFCTISQFEDILKSENFIDISWEELSYGVAHIVRARKGYKP